MTTALRRAVGLMVGMLLSIAGSAVAADPGAAGAAVEVTYLANEGFLIEVGEKKILIDALFEGEAIDWCHVNSPATQAKLEKAEAPFDHIALILTTHGHRDHFSAGPVMKHLAADPGTVFIGPPQAVKELGAKYEDRIEEVDLELFASSEFEFDGIRIEAHRIHHSQYMVKDEETGEERNKHQDVENLAYLIEIGGLRVLHVGDAALPLSRAYLESERFLKGKIDIAFLEFFDWSEETKEILELMRPDHIVFMHLPPQPEEVEKHTRYLSNKFPNAVLFQEPLEKRGF